MGRRGPKPTANSILKLRQSGRATRRGGIKLEQDMPRRPSWLVGEGKNCWERIVPKLHAAGLATSLYTEMLAMGCSSYSDFVNAEKQFLAMRNKDGTLPYLIKTAAGVVQENPILYTRNRARKEMTKFAAAFGLTAADLAGVRAVDKPDEQNDKLKYFKVVKKE